MTRKKEILLLLLWMGVALCVRAAFLTQVEVVGSDEAYYIRTAQEIAEGKTPVVFRTPFRPQPLFTALLASAVKVVKDPVRTCQWLSIVIGVLTLIPFHMCVRSFSSRADALWSDCIYALLPVAVEYSLWAMPHALFNCFLVLTLLFLLKVQTTGRVLWAVFGGAALWAAYMSRVEAFALAAVIGVTGWVLPWADSRIAGQRRKMLLVLCFAGSFAALCIPVWFWFWKETGAWQIAPTGGMGASGVVLLRWSLVADPGVFPWVAHLPCAKLSAFFGLIFFYLKNLYGFYNLLPRFLPLLLWIFTAYGVVGIFTQGLLEAKRVWLVLFFACVPILFYPLYIGEGRLIHPSILFLCMFAGPGISRFQRYMADRMGRSGMPRYGAASAICLVVVIVNFLPGYWNLRLSFLEEPFEQKQMGEWVRREISTPKVIMGSDRRGAFYAGGACKKFVCLGEANDPLKRGMKFDDYLLQSDIDLVVADTRYIPRYYPQFRFLLDQNPSRLLVPVVTLQEGSEKITLFRVSRREGSL